MKTELQAAVRPEPQEPVAVRRRFDPSAIAAALAGPLLIVGSVLGVLQRFIAGRLFPLQVDVRSQWLPYFCFFGRSLRDGHLPAWNPHVFGGLPSAADPQMGWLNLPAMALFGTLRCDTAMRMYLLAQPLIAGLGMYWFLRSERLPRPAATIGGLALALPIAGSGLFGLPWLSAALAWSAILLGATSRFVRSAAWPARLGWVAVAGLAWGQLAAAHFSHGLAIGTAALLAYLAATAVGDAMGKRRGLVRSLSYAALFLAGIFLINLAFLLPRLQYLPRTSQSLGYQRLDALSLALSRGAGDGDAIGGLELNGAWPLSMALSPGIYLGAAALVFSLAAFWAKGRRQVAIALAVFGAACYLATTKPVYEFITSTFPASKLTGLYMHSPRRFQFGLVLVIPILAALGVEAWRTQRSIVNRVAMLIPGLVVWGVLPHVSTAAPRYLSLFLLGAAAAAVALVVTAFRPLGLALLAAVLAVELAVSGISGQHKLLHEHQERVAPFEPPLMAPVRLDSYMRAGKIVQALQAHPGGRYLSVDPKAWRPWGYTGRLHSDELPLMGGQRSMIFGLEEAQGYNPIELLRNWMFVRTVDPKKIRYAVSYFRHPPSIALDLLDVRWIIGRAGGEPPAHPIRRVVRQGDWQLYSLPDAPTRASVMTSWRIVSSPEAALREVTGAHFNPTREAVLEGSGVRPVAAAAGGGSAETTAVYRQLGPQEARVDVSTKRPGVVVVRNAFDPNWTASVDGRPAVILPADYLVQGVKVPAGRHTVVLRYDDPAVGYGLLGSALALLAVAIAALALSGRIRIPMPRKSPNDPLGSNGAPVEPAPE